MKWLTIGFLLGILSSLLVPRITEHYSNRAASEVLEVLEEGGIVSGTDLTKVSLPTPGPKALVLSGERELFETVYYRGRRFHVTIYAYDAKVYAARLMRQKPYEDKWFFCEHNLFEQYVGYQVKD